MKNETPNKESVGPNYHVGDVIAPRTDQTLFRLGNCEILSLGLGTAVLECLSENTEEKTEARYNRTYYLPVLMLELFDPVL